MHSTVRTLLASAVATLVVAVPALPAHASSSTGKDKDDVATPLDLASAKLSTKGNKIVAVISTHDAFTDEDLAAPSALGIDFRLDARTVRGIAVRVVDGTVTGQVCTYEDGGPVLGAKCSDVSAKRVDDRTVTFTVKRSKVSKAKVLRWRAGALYFAGDCTSNPVKCLDTFPQGAKAYKKWTV